MDKRLFSLFVLGGVACAALAQDPRESHYYYEVLDPRHEPKQKVEGFATQRVEERLNRGLAAVPAADGKSVYLSWRLLAADGPDAAFHVFRRSGGKDKRLTRKPLTKTCDFTDTDPTAEATYWVEPAGRHAANAGGQAGQGLRVCLDSLRAYTSIPIAGGETPGKVALADLDGDGSYDFIVRTPSSNVDPGMPGDKSGTTYRLSAYLSTGRHLWTIDLGPGIEPGVWYSPFVAFDFNGDGRAEVAFKSAGDDYVKNAQGRVCGGSEYLTVVDGMTGRVIDRADWPERNDRYGNLVRQNRNQMGVAYLDGKTPCLLAARGTYKLMVVDAWTLPDGRLHREWRWDGDEENPVIRSMGAHSMVTGSRRLWLLLRNNSRAMCGTESPIKATGPQYAVTVAVSNPVERSSRLRVIFMLMPKFSAYRAPKSIALRGFTSNAEIKRPASDNEANSGSCCNVTLPKFPNPHMV